MCLQNQILLNFVSYKFESEICIHKTLNKKINPTLAYSYLLSSDFPYNLAAAFKNILSMEQANVCRCVGKSEGYCTSKHLYATF